MQRRLPPLNALRAFEAAARHGSFSLAAVELGVTHGAVSQQIRALERWFGFALFERAARRVNLTEAGGSYLAELSGAFDRVAAATERMALRRRRRDLRVNALPTFTLRWLLPRLGRFQRRHPGIELRLSTTPQPLDQVREPWDVAIRRGATGWGNAQPVAFLSEWAIPVASPALLRRRPIRLITDLARHAWLSPETRDDIWPEWLRAAGAPRLEPRRILRLEHFFYVLQAATDGLGVAIGPHALVAADLRARRLAAPLKAPRLPLVPYHVAARDPDAEASAAFLAWLVDEGARDTTPR